MKIYHIIDKRERNAREELKPYTLEGLKACFRCDEEEEDEAVGVLYVFESITDDDNAGFQLFYNTENSGQRLKIRVLCLNVTRNTREYMQLSRLSQ